MNFDYLKKNKDFARPVLLGVSLVLAALTAFRIWEYRSASVHAESIVAKAVDQGRPDPELIKAKLTKFTEAANAIKKENLFVPPVPKRHPVSTVLGIMGSEALINGKWYKVGDKIADAEVIAVEPTLVKIKWDGKEKTFAPISAMVAETPRPRGMTRIADAEKDREKKKKPKKDPKEKKTKEVKIASGHDPLGWMGVELSPGLHKKIMKLWKNASEEDKRRGMAEWNNASKEKRREMLAQLEAMPDGEMGG